MEDPQGYKLENQLRKAVPTKSFTSKRVQKIQLGGKTRKRKMHKYMKYVPYKIKKRIKQFQNKEIKNFKKLLKHVAKDNKKQKGGNIATKLVNGNTVILKDISNIMNDKMKNIEEDLTMKTPGSNEETNQETNEEKAQTKKSATTSLHPDTCVNRTILPDGTTTSNHTLCDLSEPVDYKGNEKDNNALKKMMLGRNEEEWAKETAQDSNEKFLAMLSLMKDFSGLDGGINANEDNAKSQRSH